jgi:hypothetical protein
MFVAGRDGIGTTGDEDTYDEFEVFRTSWYGYPHQSGWMTAEGAELNG